MSFDQFMKKKESVENIEESLLYATVKDFFISSSMGEINMFLSRILKDADLDDRDIYQKYVNETQDYYYFLTKYKTLNDNDKKDLVNIKRNREVEQILKPLKSKFLDFVKREDISVYDEFKIISVYEDNMTVRVNNKIYNFKLNYRRTKKNTTVINSIAT